MKIVVTSIASLQSFAAELGKRLTGGEVFELVGDVGSGKTTFTKGLAVGLAVDDDVQSPSFTISRTYAVRDGLELHHYDFYRLADPGIMMHDLAESTRDDRVITVVEWAETVEDVLPADRTVIAFYYGSGETERRVEIARPTNILKEAYAAWRENR